MSESCFPVDPDELLAKAARLRVLARSLVLDAHAAEDLVQDSLLVSLEESARGVKRPLAWLQGVLRNLAWKRLRSETRRRDREARWVNRRAPDSVLDSSAQAETLAALMEAVTQLPPPLRRTVLSYYFDDKCPAEMARAEGITVAAVHSRLRRARTELSAVLCRRFGDQEWLTGMVWIAALPKGGGLAVAGGGLVMTTGSKMAIGASLLAAALCLLWTLDWPETPAEHGGEQQLSAAGPADGDPRGTAARDVSELQDSAAGRHLLTPPSVPPVSPPGFLGWMGRVLDPSGRPSSHVRVLAERPESWTETDENGWYLLEWPRGVGPLNGRTALQAVDLGWASPVVHLPPASPPRRVDLQLRDGILLPVRVLDLRTDQPLPGVELLLSSAQWSSSALTDERGCARLCAPEPGMYWLRCSGRGSSLGRFTDQRLTMDEAVAQREVVLRVVPYPRWVRVMARDRDTGATLVDAEFRGVLLQPPPASERFGSSFLLPSEGGRLEWEVPEAQAVNLEVSAEGYLTQRLCIAEDQDDTIHADLIPHGETPVLVTDRGVPVPGAVIEWSYSPGCVMVPDGNYLFGLSPYRGDFVEGTTRTAPDGTGILPLQVYEEWGRTAHRALSFTVSSPSGKSREFGNHELRGLGSPPWLLELSPGKATVVFQALDQRGRPVADLSVQLVSMENPGMDRAVSMMPGTRVEGVTDQEGRFTAEVRAPSHLGWVACLGEARYSSDRTQSVVQGEDHHVMARLLVADLSLAGLVVEHDGRPPSGWLVARVVLPEGGGAAWQIDSTGLSVPYLGEPYSDVAEDGSFRFVGLPPCTVGVTVLDWNESSGYLVDPVVAQTGTEGLRIVLPPPRSFRVTVTDARTGSPINRASVEFLEPASAEEGEGPLLDRHLFTGSDGVALFQRVPPECSLLEVRAGGHAEQVVDLAGLSYGTEQRIKVALEPGRGVWIRFRGQDGTLVPGPARLERSDRQPGCRSCQVHFSGSDFWYLSAPFGELALRMVNANGQIIGEPVVLDSGTEDLELELPWPPVPGDE